MPRMCTSPHRCPCLIAVTALFLIGYSADAQAVPPQQSLQTNAAQPPHLAAVDLQPQQPQQIANAAADSHRIAQRMECQNDIRKHCAKLLEQLNPGETLTDMDAFNCLKDVTDFLENKCVLAVWEFNIDPIQNVSFVGALRQFCSLEINQNPQLEKCTIGTRPGYALNCMKEHLQRMGQESRCFQFLQRTEYLAFSDFGLVSYPYDLVCEEDIWEDEDEDDDEDEPCKDDPV